MANTHAEKARQSLIVLDAEIKVHEDYGSVRSFAAAIGVDYNTFRRWLKGERDIPYWAILESIDRLGLTAEDFNRRVEARMPAE